MSDSPSHTGDGQDSYAAVDLGSNSFHLLVARRTHGELRVLDRIKEMVRLGAGLDADGRLDDATLTRAIDCLARFGQRLRGIPPGNIRAVGTQTLRRMHSPNAFLVVAETALGCPVDIIAGREEARLIYLGVSQDVSGVDERRLVVDIGGGSTEIASGAGTEAELLESLQFGCVALTQKYFPDGSISPDRWQASLRAVQAELQELRLRFVQMGWDRAIGSSGTIRAVAAICQAAGWTERDIKLSALDRLRTVLLEQGHTDDLNLAGLSERRRPVLAGGVVILEACFRTLGVEAMAVSRFALREGLLYDLFGRLEKRDPRDKTVRAFVARYGVDEDQAGRVRSVALRALDQISAAAGLGAPHREMLGWAAMLHETGLAVSHSHYQRHSGYLVGQSDMAGFSRQEQLFLAALVSFHRRSVPPDYADTLPPRLRDSLRYLLFCLRLGWILCRTREETAIPDYSLTIEDSRIDVCFPTPWIAARPLTAADLDQEREILRAVDFQFDYRADDADAT